MFQVGQRLRRERVHVYTILDWDGDRAEDTCFETELQAMNVHYLPRDSQHRSFETRIRTMNVMALP